MGMRNINANILIPYNLCQIISQVYSLILFELNQSNPSKHLPYVITICFIFQLIGLCVSHVISSSYCQNFANLNLLEVIKNVSTSIIVYFVLIILMGAPILKETLNTFYLSVLLTILTTVPLLFFCKSNNNILLVLINRMRFENKVENFIIVSSLLTIIGAWFGAFPIALDWYQPWQEWPITSSVAAIVANLFSNSLCLFSLLCKSFRKIKYF